MTDEILTSRICDIRTRSEEILHAIQKQDDHTLSIIVREEAAAYDHLQGRLFDEMQNGCSPALQKLARTVYTFFQTLQELRETQLPRDLGEETSEKEALEESKGLLEEYILDSIEQSLRICLLINSEEYEEMM